MLAFIAMRFGQLMQGLARRYSCVHARAVNYMLRRLWLLAIAIAIATAIAMLLRRACGGRVGLGMDGIRGSMAPERRPSLGLRLRLRLRLHMLRRHLGLRVPIRYAQLTLSSLQRRLQCSACLLFAAVLCVRLSLTH